MPGLVVGRVATEGFQKLLRTNVRGYNTLRYLSHLGTVTCDLSVSSVTGLKGTGTV